MNPPRRPGLSGSALGEKKGEISPRKRTLSVGIKMKAMRSTCVLVLLTAVVFVASQGSFFWLDADRQDDIPMHYEAMSALS